MTIHLPPEIERSIQAAVHSGHFASVDDAMTEAASMLLERLRQGQAEEMESTRQAVAEMKAGSGRPAADMLADMQRIINGKHSQ
jgi:Arc/MetJ-type ribon-helix-helix transcriptional regulator